MATEPETETPFSYGVRVTAKYRNGKTAVIEWEGYGLLRELLDAIEDEAERNGWFVDPEAGGQ